MSQPWEIHFNVWQLYDHEDWPNHRSMVFRDKWYQDMEGEFHPEFIWVIIYIWVNYEYVIYIYPYR